uniref:antigen peptide transporter 1 n=1 Tax=Doryrhamphus excisus TaxID=161450 RepID=UPI0025AE29AE|nr:antigen peptide transporter 1 [Doryrhamphus excisus]XP_057909435.1 antigen peptide transporter 1 [Doryrhamphus excisus]XP_057909437.1 antigen peptide transporter 1 [Doryrhamphus excisus]XP_057909438.1 antigen peptide transporter 1 [Doryrhamphus excisus]XP_057909439.1 antigen peptide transporter 1 [Doryrhamphus excisus]
MHKRNHLLVPLLLLCVDVCAVRGLRLLQLSMLLPRFPLVALWAEELTRAGLLLVTSVSCRGDLSWASSLLVLCLHLPVYVSLLSGMGWSSEEEVWGWHSWERLLQSYVVTAVAWIYWSQYVSLWTSVSGEAEKPKEDIGSSLRRLIGFMRPYLGRFVFVLFLVLFSSYGEMAIPLYTGRVTDWITNQEAPEAFHEAVKIMATMTAVSAVLEFMGDLVYISTMRCIHTAVQDSVFQAVLKQDIAFFDATTTGELVSRITKDTDDMSEALSEKLSLVMWYTSRFLFLLYFMMTQSWKLSLLSCMGLPIIWVIPEFIGRFSQTLSAKVQESVAKANQVATETFSCIKTVKSFANEDGETQRYREAMEEIYGLHKIQAAVYGITTSANSLSTLAMKVCILYYGGMLVTRGAVSSGTLVSFVLYELQFASAVEAFMHSYPEVRKAVGASEKIFEYLDRKPQIPPEGTLAPANLEGHVQFKNVTFAYSQSTDDDSLVLKNVSLEIKPGCITALVGLNRSGKSTCVKLLERFYQAQSGEILLDGLPLQSYQDTYLRQKIAVVSQECLLFARPVWENIKYGCDASDEDMYRAARLASAHSFITALSKGYDTDAGEKGAQLSGGQRQRIAIARALIRRPKILILDNATSDLDTENEHQVHQALLSQGKECSVLLISNKMSVAKKADHIVVLHNGMVEAQGCHDELLKRGGRYAELVTKEGH